MTRRVAVLFACGIVVGAGCQPGGAAPQPKQGPPSVSFSVRKAQIPTRGMVVGISNTSSDTTLTDIVVRVQNSDEPGERSHRVDAELRPRDTITVGWMELDGWKLRPGDRVEVTCAQYAQPATYVVPED